MEVSHIEKSGFACRHCSGEVVIFDKMCHLRSHIRRVHKALKAVTKDSISEVIPRVAEVSASKNIVDSAVPEPTPTVSMESADYLFESEDGGRKLPLHIDRPEMSGCTLVELDPSSVIDDAVLADVIGHNEPSCPTEVNQSIDAIVPDQHGEILTLDQLIDASIACDKLAVDQGRSAWGFVPPVFNRQVKPKAVKRLFGHTRPAAKATFDRRRQVALQLNGRVISSVVNELHSMVLSDSTILKDSDNSAIDQLRKLDTRSTRRQLPREVYLAILITARKFTAAHETPASRGGATVDSEVQEAARQFNIQLNDQTAIEETSKIPRQSEMQQALSDFCADIGTKPGIDQDDAMLLADVYKSYGTCTNQLLLDSDGTSSLDGLELMSDLEGGDMLPRAETRRARPEATKKSSRRQEYDKELRRTGRAVTTDCWITSSIRRTCPEDIVLPPVPKSPRSIARAAREFRKCFGVVKPRQRKAATSTTASKPTLRSAVRVASSSPAKQDASSRR